MTGREPWHGTLGGYTNHRCRCESCRAAMHAYSAALYATGIFHAPCVICGRPARKYGGRGRCLACYHAAVEAPHGTESRYKRGCKCVACKAAAAAARRARRHANLEASRAYDREYKRRRARSAAS